MDRLRASPEQFSAMLDFMERHGDLSRPQPGAQGRLRTENLWTELTELLNSMGGSAVQKQSEKWKRVWSDWKTKTKKKAGIIRRDTHGTGGGPSQTRPLNPLEERVVRIMGIGSITGQEEIPEAGFEVPLPPPTPETCLEVLTPLHSSGRAPPPDPEWLIEHSYPVQVPEPEQNIEVASVPHTTGGEMPSNSNRTQESNTGGTMASPTAPSTPRRRRLVAQSRRPRRHQTPFEQATSEFVRIEEARLRLEERRIAMQHERDMEQLRVESQRIAMEERRNNTFERIAEVCNKMMEFFDRFPIAQ